MKHDNAKSWNEMVNQGNGRIIYNQIRPRHRGSSIRIVIMDDNTTSSNPNDVII